MSPPPLGGCCVAVCSLTVLMVRGKMVPPYSLPQPGDLTPFAFQQPLTEQQGQSAHTVPQLSCVVSLVNGWDSKLQTLKTQHQAYLTPCFGVELLRAVSDDPCPRKPVPHLHVAWNLCCSTVKSSSQVIYHLCLPLSPANKSPFAAPCRVFCPWKGKIFSSKCTPGWRMLSPSATKEIPTQCCGNPGPVFSFSPGVHATAHSRESCPFFKPQSLSSTWYWQKTCGTQYPLLPRIKWVLSLGCKHNFTPANECI